MDDQIEQFVKTGSRSEPILESFLPDIHDEKDLETRDSKILQNILPEEVWILIAEKLTESRYELHQDFGSLINSSSYFRKLLESKRVLYLFECVFLIANPWILATTKDDKGIPSDSDSESDWETVDEDSDAGSNSDDEKNPIELPNQEPISAIKSCREVCSVWNQSVDEILFEQIISPSREGLHSLEKKILKHTKCQRFENTNDVNKFLNFFNHTHPKRGPDGLYPQGIKDRSPFGPREVVLSLSCDDDDTERDPDFLKAIETLLDAYAHHIKSLAVYLNGYNVYIGGHTSYLRNVIRFVKMAPKLKRLTIGDYATNFYGSLDEAINGQPGLQIEGNPQYQLPRFPDLVELRTSGLAVHIFEHLIQNNNHVNILTVGRNLEGNYNISNLPFPKLQILHLNFCNMEQVAMLENLEFPWPLTQLTFSYCYAPDFPDYSRIFRVIGSNWCSTLTYLNIVLPEAQTKKDYRTVLEHTSNERLFLPRLETFKLTLYQQFFLDFILPTANSLKKLSIIQINNRTSFPIPTISKRDKKRETIKFVALDGRLKNSNIWELFPNLKYVYTIGCKQSGDLIEEISR